MQKAIIVTYDDLPTELQNVLYEVWNIEEAYNGDYIYWSDHLAENFPTLDKWIQENKEIQQFQEDNPMCSILLNFSW